MVDDLKQSVKRVKSGGAGRSSSSPLQNGEGNPSSSSPGQGTVTSDPPCAACKSLRRKCTKDCIFLPYFPRDDPEKFARVHKVFGASNVAKMLQELPQHQREDAVASLEYEAQARVQDPVYGCVGILCILQRQVSALKQQVAVLESQAGISSKQENTLEVPEYLQKDSDQVGQEIMTIAEDLGNLDSHLGQNESTDVNGDLVEFMQSGSFGQNHDMCENGEISGLLQNHLFDPQSYLSPEDEFRPDN